MRVTAALFCSFVLASPAATSPATRLARALADAIADAAQGRPLELGAPEDRTSRGAAFALDLRALVAARLQGRSALTDTGPRLRVTWVVSETPQRLVASARVLDEPSGRLVDLLSVSAETDDGVLELARERAPSAGRAIEVVSAARTPPLDAAPLDLAFVDDERLVVLFAEAVALYRIEDTALAREHGEALPGPFAPVRSSGGLVAVAPREAALWVMTSRSPKAVLFALEGRRLVRRHEAGALPWPGCVGGLRFRPGTNLIEGNVAALGPGPFLDLATGEADLAVMPDGRLHTASATEVDALRVGPTLAPLFGGLLAASSAEPPGRSDAVLLLAREGGWRAIERLPVDGAVRALAARQRGDTARLVAAIDEAGGGTHLLLLELRRPETTQP